MEYSVNLALVVGTLVGAIANVLAVGLALRARRRRFMRTLDDEIRRAVWDYALICSENGTSHSLSGFSPAEVRDYHLRMTQGREVPQAIYDASLEFVQESFTWRQECYRPSVPRWVLGLLPHADAYRYHLEWGAHLRELVDNGEMNQVRTDRRRLAMIAICFAVVLRARRFFS
jgi:hypothetical protein